MVDNQCHHKKCHEYILSLLDRLVAEISNTLREKTKGIRKLWAEAMGVARFITLPFSQMKRSDGPGDDIVEGRGKKGTYSYSLRVSASGLRSKGMKVRRVWRLPVAAAQLMVAVSHCCPHSPVRSHPFFSRTVLIAPHHGSDCTDVKVKWRNAMPGVLLCRTVVRLRN